MGDEQVIHQLIAALNTINDPTITPQQRQQANEVRSFSSFLFYSPFFSDVHFCDFFSFVIRSKRVLGVIIVEYIWCKQTSPISPNILVYSYWNVSTSFYCFVLSIFLIMLLFLFIPLYPTSSPHR